MSWKNYPVTIMYSFLNCPCLPFLSTITLLLFGSSSLASDISLLSANENEQLFYDINIRLTGEIRDGDSQKVLALLTEQKKKAKKYDTIEVVVELSSPGGSFVEGLNLATLFAEQKIATIVRTNSECMSACALAFLGGTSAFSGQGNLEAERTLEMGSRLGFHPPFPSLEKSNYSDEEMQTIFGVGIRVVSLLIEKAAEYNVNVADIPLLLSGSRTTFYEIDTVDKAGMFDVRVSIGPYPKLVNLFMIKNTCINTYYHMNGKSSTDGFKTADSVRDEFIEMSKLSENGEERRVISVRNTLRANGVVATMPIAHSANGKSYVWCVYYTDGQLIRYREAGALADLEEFKPLERYGDSPGTEQMVAIYKTYEYLPPDTLLGQFGAALETAQGQQTGWPLGR